MAFLISILGSKLGPLIFGNSQSVSIAETDSDSLVFWIGQLSIADKEHFMILIDRHIQNILNKN